MLFFRYVNVAIRGTAKERNWKTSKKKEVFPCAQFSFYRLSFSFKRRASEREQRRRSHIIFHYLKPERMTTDDDDWARKRRAENSCTFDSMSGTEYNNEKVYPLFLRAASLCKWKIIVLCTKGEVFHARIRSSEAENGARLCKFLHLRLSWTLSQPNGVQNTVREFSRDFSPRTNEILHCNSRWYFNGGGNFSEKFFSRVFKDGKESF